MVNLIIFEAILFRSGHFLQGDMITAMPGDPIFGIGQILDKSKKGVPSIPNIRVTVKRPDIDQESFGYD
jgi:hypothetical protein